MTVRQIDVGGQSQDVREESFESGTEHWNEYNLANGERVRIKLVVHKIFRLLDAEGNPKFSAEGDPEVAVRHAIQVSASGGPEPDRRGEVH